MKSWFPRGVAILLGALVACVLGGAHAQEKDNVAGPFVPTPWPIVDELLKLAEIGPRDVVYDLGSGDGRLVITAAKRYGARGVGIDLQKELVDRATAGAAREGVGASVRFMQGDLFEANFSEATVVTLYLLPRFVTRLVPKFRSELRPGSRIVSHDYPLAPWPPDKTMSFEVDEKESITGSKRTVLYYYVVPARVQGTWSISLPKSVLAAPLTIELSQTVEATTGTAYVGADSFALRDPVVRGERLRFGLLTRGRLLRFDGIVSASTIAGDVSVSGTPGQERWTAQRKAP